MGQLLKTESETERYFKVQTRKGGNGDVSLQPFGLPQTPRPLPPPRDSATGNTRGDRAGLREEGEEMAQALQHELRGCPAPPQRLRGSVAPDREGGIRCRSVGQEGHE